MLADFGAICRPLNSISPKVSNRAKLDHAFEYILTELALYVL